MCASWLRCGATCFPSFPPSSSFCSQQLAYGGAGVAAAGAGGVGAGEELVDAGAGVDDGTLYCTCRQPTFGEMIGCDSKTCAIEWFHLGCVNLTVAPTGTWYCPTCQEKRREAAARKAGGGYRGGGGGGGGRKE